MSGERFFAGEKVRHAKLGEGTIRILKPFEKSYVEFGGGNHVWVQNAELIKQN